MSVSTAKVSLEIFSDQFTLTQRSALNEKMRRIQDGLDAQVTATPQNLLAFSLEGPLSAGNNVAPLQILPADALISKIVVLLKVSGFVTFRLNVGATPWQTSLMVSGPITNIAIGSLPMSSTQAVSLDILSVSGAASGLTLIVQGTFS